MSDLNEIERGTRALWGERAAAFAQGLLFSRIVIVLATGLFAAAHFVPDWNAIAVPAVMVVVVLSILQLIVDRDATKQLIAAENATVAARKAASDLAELQRKLELVEEARQNDHRERERSLSELEQRRISALSEYDQQIIRATRLYTGLTGMQDRILKGIGHSSRVDTERMIADMLDVHGRLMAIAAGFRMDQHWTLCVYKAGLDAAGNIVLRCIAHHRSTHCRLDEARSFPDGVGVVGFTYYHGQEHVVSDITKLEYRSVFGIEGSLARPHDNLRYRSFAAVPIRTEETGKPWGVAVATIEAADHFSDEDSSGFRPVEVPRTLASVVALAVRANELNQTPPAPLPAERS